MLTIGKAVAVVTTRCRTGTRANWTRATRAFRGHHRQLDGTSAPRRQTTTLTLMRMRTSVDDSLNVGVANIVTVAVTIDTAAESRAALRHARPGSVSTRLSYSMQLVAILRRG